MPNNQKDEFAPHTLAGREYGLKHGVTSAEAHKRIQQAIQLVHYFCDPETALEIDRKIAGWRPPEPEPEENESANDFSGNQTTKATKRTKKKT